MITLKPRRVLLYLSQDGSCKRLAWLLFVPSFSVLLSAFFGKDLIIKHSKVSQSLLQGCDVGRYLTSESPVSASRNASGACSPARSSARGVTARVQLPWRGKSLVVVGHASSVLSARGKTRGRPRPFNSLSVTVKSRQSIRRLENCKKTCV